jgi:radical SAM protein with 4Fe4S-binding SPASM domain
MDLDLFQQVIDQLGEYLFLIYLFNWGEPFLNPATFDMIGAARAKGIKVLTASNGHPLAQEENARRLVQAGLDGLIVALDGITQETYSWYRQGGDLETALQGIRNVVAQKRAQKSLLPHLTITFLVMRHNEAEIPRLRELARSLGVNALTLKKLDCNIVDPDLESKVGAQKLYWEMVPRDPRYQRHPYASGGDPRLREQNPCKNLWNCPVIHWNGMVSACCFDCDERQVLGDMRTDTLRNIWRGSAYRRLRRQFRLDWRQLPLCRNCPCAYVGGDLHGEHIAEIIIYT